MKAERTILAWEIRAREPWLRLPWREIISRKDLLLRLVRRDFLASYQQTILGSAWVLIQPVLVTLTYILIFKSIIGVSTAGLPSSLFYLSGIIFWNFFSDSISNISHTYISYSAIFNKVYFPRLIAALSGLVVHLARLAIQFLLFLCVFFYFLIHKGEISPNTGILLFPVCILLLSGLSLGGGLILASLTAKYRDIQHLLSFILRIVMFITPVIYPLSIVPGKFRILFLLNPLTPVFELFRYGFLGNGYHDFYALLYSTGFVIITLLAGIVLFNRRDGNIMDLI